MDLQKFLLIMEKDGEQGRWEMEKMGNWENMVERISMSVRF